MEKKKKKLSALSLSLDFLSPSSPCCLLSQEVWCKYEAEGPTDGEHGREKKKERMRVSLSPSIARIPEREK